MKRNLSNLDRLVRIVLAAVFTYLYVTGIVTGGFGIVLLVVAVILTLTAIVAFCPLYALLKFSTYKN